jgi:hypothetical protein
MPAAHHPCPRNHEPVAHLLRGDARVVTLKSAAGAGRNRDQGAADQTNLVDEQLGGRDVLV